MLGSEVLDVAIGIIFVFLLVSIMASAVREGLEAWLKTRATHLELGIRQLLQDPSGTGLAKQLFDHPLIYSLYPGPYQPLQSGKLPLALTRGRNLPSYIPSKNFALALMDMAARGPEVDGKSSHASTAAITFDSVRANVSLIQSPPVQRALLVALDNAQGDLQKARQNLEDWYDSAMDRVSGWYKRSTQWILFVIGFAIAIALNVNTMVIADHLYREKATRDALVARAQTAVSDPNYDTRKFGEIKQDLDSLKLPMGGSPLQDLKERPFRSLGGWLLTALAASFGAPFWFDLLNKLMVVRSTVKPHEKSPEEASQDRQVKQDKPAVSVVAPAAQTGQAAQPGQATAAAPVVPTALTAPSADDVTDGCDVPITGMTKDEELPASVGGVR
jgi:hypothetical protein